MKNVVMLVVDALSYWYIQEFKKAYRESFFNELESKTLHCTEMYSTGPFTEAALQGMLASQYSLDNHNNMTWFRDSNEMVLKVLQDNGYQIYVGGQPIFFSGFHADVWSHETFAEKFNFEARAESSLWKSKIKYFFSLYDRGEINEREKGLLEDVVNFIFECFNDGSKPEKQKEYQSFIKDKRLYVENLLRLKKEHSFYKYFLDKEKIEVGGYARTVNNIYRSLPEADEAKICSEIEYRNKKRFIEINRKFANPELIEKNITGYDNRCLQTNNAAIEHIRGVDYTEPTMGREIEHFLEWMDCREEGKPFFSYIHVMDFHHRENIMENGEEDYRVKLREVESSLQKMPDMINMSVTKTLSILHIERELRRFWEELEKRDFFRDSYLIITADHGISNFMYPLRDVSNERWAYKKTNFNVPFYMAGSGIKAEKNDELLDGVDIPVTLLNILKIPVPEEYKGKFFIGQHNIHNFVRTEWINGCPNVCKEIIKFGIRDKKYSITYKASLNEFIDSGECACFYNLQEDPDETVNLAVDDRNKEILNRYLPMIRQRWYELLQHYYLDYEGKYFDKNRTFNVLREQPYRITRWMEEQDRFSWEDFCEKIAGKKIILYGATEYAKEFLGKFNFRIYEIWDDNAEKHNTCFMGHLVKNPYEVTQNADEYVFIITSQYEIEARILLDDMKFEHVYIGKQILKGAK